VELLKTAALMVRSIVLSAQSAGQQRLLWLQQSAAVGGNVGEVVRLRDENRRLKSENRLLKARDADAPFRKRYSPLQRLQILWHMAYYRIPRSRVKEHFLIATPTLYRWLHAAQEGYLGERVVVRRRWNRLEQPIRVRTMERRADGQGRADTGIPHMLS
jgi:transposase-like protein